MDASDKRNMVNRLCMEVMELIFTDIAQAKGLDHEDKDLMLISIATSIGASICGTIHASNGKDDMALNATYALIVRGMAEGLAEYAGRTGEATWGKGLKAEVAVGRAINKQRRRR